MYAKLQFNPAVNVYSMNNILTAMVGVLTGTTDLASMNANIDLTGSSFTASWAPSGWTTHDNAPLDGGYVLKAPIHDDATKFKYLKLLVSGSAIYGNLYETWDATAHTGTNRATTTLANTNGMTILNFAPAGVSDVVQVHISASKNHASFQYVKTNATVTSPVAGIYEYNRTSVWDTVTNGYLPVVCTNTSNGLGDAALNTNTDPINAIFNSCRFVSNANLANQTDYLGDATYGAQMGISTPFGSMFPSAWTISTTSCTKLSDMIGDTPTNSKFFDASDIKVHPLYAFGAVRPDHRHAGGVISTLAEQYFTTSGTWGAFDEIDISGKTYIIWALGNTYRLAVRKG